VCFGLVVGYITYRTLARTTEKVAISDLATVIGAIGGAAITGLFGPTDGSS
jgi:outer membrane lipoprotein SlyB